MNHMLTLEKLTLGPGYVGHCDCSDPDWRDHGWDGVVLFTGDSEQEVIDLHHDHVLEVEGGAE